MKKEMLAFVVRSKGHQALHSHPFVAHYQNDTLTHSAHAMHLVQLLAIYQALETQLKKCNYALLPATLSFLLERSNAIRADLTYLSVNFDKQPLLKSTQTYVKKINSLDLTKPEQEYTLIMHFLTRILGDLFGGQHLGATVKKMYTQTNSLETSEGVKFYEFPKNARKNLLSWIEIQDWCSQYFGVIEDAFQHHVALFTELEDYIQAEPKIKERQNLLAHQGFFSTKKMCAFATLAAGVAMVSTVLYSQLSA